MGKVVFDGFTSLRLKEKIQKPDQSLTTEELHDLLVQGPGKLGHNGSFSWIILLGYSVRNLLHVIIKHKHNVGFDLVQLRTNVNNCMDTFFKSN